MLEFIKEKISGNLVAHSETTKFKTYWIDECGAWTYLQVVQGVKLGPRVGSLIPFNSLEEAKSAANEMESET